MSRPSIDRRPYGASSDAVCPSSFCAQQESATPCKAQRKGTSFGVGGGGAELPMAMRGAAGMVTKRSRTERHQPIRANTDRERILRKTAVFRTVQHGLIRTDTVTSEFEVRAPHRETILLHRRSSNGRQNAHPVRSPAPSAWLNRL